MAEDEYRADLYDILGLEAGTDATVVARAYKKKSLLHHPDRGGDVTKFLELKHARDILLDPKKKEEYDKKLSKELMARKRQRERDAEMDSKRRKMRDEFLRKEKDADRKMHDQQSSHRYRSELNSLREKAMARQHEMQRRLAQEARRQQEMGRAQATEPASKSQRTVTFKWDRRHFSHSDDTINRQLREYGTIESIKLKSTSVKVLFASRSAAAQAVRVEGHKSCWREVSLQGHIVDADGAEADAVNTTDSTAPCLPGGPISIEEHLEYERVVLKKLRDHIQRQRGAASTSAHAP